jgi:DNA mismatch endonuclease, patch repair protein
MQDRVSETRPVPSSAAVTARMRIQRRKDTQAEILVRKDLFARGARYRVNYPVPTSRRRTIDIAFTRAKVAVFIDGCFWHGCPEHGTSPQANREWWAAKIAGNKDRDVATAARLTELGWLVLRFWEHEDPAHVASLITAEVLCRTDGPPQVVR